MVACVRENLLRVVKGAVHSRFAIGRHSNLITKGIPDSLGLFSSWGYLECIPGFPVVQIQESKNEIDKHSAFNHRRSHYDFRLFDIMLPSCARLHPHAEIVLPFDYSLEQTFF